MEGNKYLAKKGRGRLKKTQLETGLINCMCLIEDKAIDRNEWKARIHVINPRWQDKGLVCCCHC